MAGPLENSKHERVVQAIFSGATLAEAANAGGFTGRWPESHACNIVKRPECRARLEELHEQAASAKVMNIRERLERLSEIARDRDIDREGECIRAIAEMNRMQKIYLVGTEVNVEQKVVNITVVSERSERATRLIIAGTKTSLETDNIPDTSRESEEEEEPTCSLPFPEPLKKPSTSLS